MVLWTTIVNQVDHQEHGQFPIDKKFKVNSVERFMVTWLSCNCVPIFDMISQNIINAVSI